MHILVGICSCISAKERRDAVRETWLQQSPEGMECKFFVGRRLAMSEEDDVITLWVNDDYDHLPEKVLAFYQYALANYDFDWIFKCDDDTYISLDRLSELANPAFDLIGDMSLQNRGFPSGGAGYFLSRSLVEKIVAFPDIPAVGPEDVIFGGIANRLDAPRHATARLQLSTDSFPLPSNDVVTAHWCSPNQLRAIQRFLTQEPIICYQAFHDHWKDRLLFYEDGFFRRQDTSCMGCYLVDGHSLRLQWFKWQEEFLTRKGKEYAGNHIVLQKEGDSLDLYERCAPCLSMDIPLYIHLGCGTHILPHWLNLDRDDVDITEPLPWEDRSVDAYFLEHVIEHILPAEAYLFFEEVWRTLKEGGVLRLAFPDLLRIAENVTPEYINFLQEKGWGDGSPESALKNIIVNHDHKAIWTCDTMTVVLERMGFHVTQFPLGKSYYEHLKNIELHHSQLGMEFNLLETSCLEATKPLLMA